MKRQTLDAILRAKTARQAIVIARNLSTGEDQLFGRDDGIGSLPDVVQTAVQKAFQLGKSASVEADGAEFFIEVHIPSPRIMLVGAVHISQALAPMTRRIGFDVTIIDPRTAFATPERFPGEVIRAEWPDEVFDEQPLDAYTGVASLTHDPKIDDPALDAALRSECFYIGALGSRKTHEKRVARLEALGHDRASIDRIRSPIGLDIGAANPSEIAVAVLAE
ncbi:MAG: XdhC family protein, partial [Pseudomonadota bacterium]